MSHTVKYSTKHDALYCSDCDIWMDSACDDLDCEYCPERPELPSQIKDSSDDVTYKRVKCANGYYA